MSRRLSLTLALLLGTVALPLPASAEPLRINGSTTVNPVVAEAAEILRAEKNMEIQVDTQGGSAGGISALGEGLVQIAMSSRPRAATATAPSIPKVDFREIQIGEDAVAWWSRRCLGRRREGAHPGNKSATSTRDRITNWQPVGGPDRRIAFFNKEPGRGTWEVFGKWLYGNAKRRRWSASRKSAATRRPATRSARHAAR